MFLRRLTQQTGTTVVGKEAAGHMMMMTTGRMETMGTTTGP
jgi:hypothetical protein